MRAPTFLAWGALVLALAVASPASARPKRTPKPKVPTLVFSDPAGDDHGPGRYAYPTDAAFTAGAFDLREVSVDVDRRKVTLRLKLAGPVTDPWASSTWGGPGFSLQLFQIYLATENEPKQRRGRKPPKPRGYDVALPGIQARFADGERWDRVVLATADEPRSVQKRVKRLDAFGKGAVIVPAAKEITVDGDTVVITLPRRAFGKRDPKHWGVQVVVGSTDFYAAEDQLLTRLVNARPGGFRFGGGHDGLCDPNVIDLLDDDAAPQKQQLAWKCDVDGAGRATLSLLHR
ncbi:MAG: hypothetical protein EP329_24895 [Deltaproteobacteria bacterium]|nr:MAG: hypothetical protein EP329_24895 [Deltaproteobacteria bacterium]